MVFVSFVAWLVVARFGRCVFVLHLVFLLDIALAYVVVMVVNVEMLSPPSKSTSGTIIK